MKVLVHVTLKTDVLDPQGKAIQHACASLGYEAVEGVRQGKLFDLTLAAVTEDEARRLAGEIGEKLLANPVIEDYQIVRIEA